MTKNLTKDESRRVKKLKSLKEKYDDKYHTYHKAIRGETILSYEEREKLIEEMNSLAKEIQWLEG